jgi:hypothetical protein
MRPAGKDNSENKLGWSLQRPPSYANAGKAQKKYRNKICIGLETLASRELSIHRSLDTQL